MNMVQNIGGGSGVVTVPGSQKASSAGLKDGRYEARGVLEEGSNPFFNGAISFIPRPLGLIFDTKRVDANTIRLTIRTSGMAQLIKLQRNPFDPDPSRRAAYRASGFDVSRVSNAFRYANIALVDVDSAPKLVLSAYVNDYYRAELRFSAPLIAER